MANFDHAVVIGGSMAGLLTARVLSDHFAQVGTGLPRYRRTCTKASTPMRRSGMPSVRRAKAVPSGDMRP